MVEASIRSTDEINLSDNSAESNVPIRQLSLTRGQVDMWITHRIERRNYLYKQTGNIFEYFIALKVSFLIIVIMTAAYKYNTNFYHTAGAISISWCIFYSIRIVRLFLNLKITNDYIKRKHVWVTIIKNTFAIIGYAQIGLYCFFGICRIIYAVIAPLAIQIFVPIILKEKSTNNCFTVMRVLKITLSIFRAAFIFILLLAYVSKVEVPTPAIFVPLWLLLFALLICSLLFLCINIIILISIVKEKTFKSELIGAIWVEICFLITITILLCLIFMVFMEMDDQYIYSRVKLISELGLGLFSASGLYFIIFRKKIGVFFEYLLFYEETVIEAEVDKCAIEYNKPIELAQISLASNIIAIKDSSSCFRLCSIKENERQLDTEEMQTERIIDKNVNQENKLFKAKILSTKGLFRKNVDIKMARNIMPIYTKESKISQIAIIDCVICFSKKVDCFFLPCGHSGVCLDCSVAILKTSGSCHLCRKV